MPGEVQTKASESELKPGIRGWLLVFVLWLGVVNPVFWIGFNFVVFARLEAANPSDAVLMQETGWDVMIWVVTLIREGMHVAAALLLYFHWKPISAWVALGVLWLAGPLLILLSWAVMHDSELSVAGLARSVFWALVWSLFLFQSRRVKLTYRFRIG